MAWAHAILGFLSILYQFLSVLYSCYLLYLEFFKKKDVYVEEVVGGYLDIIDKATKRNTCSTEMKVVDLEAARNPSQSLPEAMEKSIFLTSTAMHHLVAS